MEDAMYPLNGKTHRIMFGLLIEVAHYRACQMKTLKILDPKNETLIFVGINFVDSPN
jgi:hypothetical protein